MPVQECPPISLHRVKEGSKRRGVCHPTGPPFPWSTEEPLRPAVGDKLRKARNPGGWQTDGSWRTGPVKPGTRWRNCSASHGTSGQSGTRTQELLGRTSAPTYWVLGPGREMNNCQAWGGTPGQSQGLRTSWATSGKSIPSEPLFFSSVDASMMLGGSEIT